MDLAEFLLARLAEDQDAARVATYSQEDAASDVLEWHLDNTARPAEVVGSDGLGIIKARTQHPGMLAHVARWDPARVLAEVEAKRAILDLHELDVCEEPAHFDRFTGDRIGPEYEVTCTVCGWATSDASAACPTLRALALPYADHPECHPSWLPPDKVEPAG